MPANEREPYDGQAATVTNCSLTTDATPEAWARVVSKSVTAMSKEHACPALVPATLPSQCFPTSRTPGH